MGLFSSDYNYLGINIGTTSIKLVELTNENGIPRLVTYGFTDQSVDIIKDDSDLAKGEVARIIKRLHKETGATTQKVITALPTFSVFSSIISLPQMPKKDLAGAIKWEAKKIIPVPLEDIILDWHILRGNPKGGLADQLKNIFGKKEVYSKEEKANKDKKQQSNGEEEKQPSSLPEDMDIKVLITGAPKNLVTKYIDIFQQAQLNLLSLETEIFSLVRSLVGSDKSTLMIVDIGGLSTNISIIQNGLAVVNRSIGLGGKNITDEISQNLDVSFERAEQFKRDVGIGGGDSNSSVFKSVEGVVTPVIDEIKYTIDFFKNQSHLVPQGKSENIEKIILTGGGALIPYLPQYLTNSLGIKAFIGDPWARVIYPQELKPVFEEVGPQLAVAVGLAMREIE